MTGSKLAVSLVVLGSAACAGVGLVLLALSWSAPVPDHWGFRGFTILFVVTFGRIGALLASRRPENLLGWVLLAAGAAAAVQLLTEEYAIYGVIDRAAPLPGAVAAGWMNSWIWFVGVTLIVTYSLLLFPSGSLVSPRWRVVGWLVAANMIMGVTGLAFARGPLNNAPHIDNPFPLLGEFGRSLFSAGYYGLVLLALASAGSLVVRYRRATGVGRQQLKWLALEAVLIAIAIFITGLSQAFAPDFKPAQVLFIVVLSLMPVAIGLAVLRYRLYDIDILINRTIVYAATTAAIGVAFFAGIVVLQAVLRPLTNGSEIAVAVSTLVSVGLAQPLRARMQGVVDRRFYRSRYDAARTLDAFSDRLRDEVDLDAVRADLLRAVRDTVQPTHAGVWLREVER